jgi:hypothetical protein
MLAQSPHSYSHSITLYKGNADIIVEYVQGPGDSASMTLAWSSDYFEKEVINPVFAPLPTEETSTETPTVTLTGTPTERPTKPTETTPPPTQPSPRLCWCEIFCPDGEAAAPAPNLADMLAKLANPQTLDAAEILYRVRDEVLDTTPLGRHYISLYYDHAPEIAQLMFADQALFNQGYDLVDLFLPGLQALLDGQGDDVVATADQVAQVNAFLDALEAAGSSELRDVLQTERAARPLEDMVGKNMDEAWSSLNGYTLEWKPPLGPEDTITIKKRKRLPVKFSLLDINGDFVEDPSITLVLLDESGRAVVGPVGLSNNPNKGLKIAGYQYHFNLNTSVLEEGTYTLRVTYHLGTVRQSEDLILVVVKK